MGNYAKKWLSNWMKEQNILEGIVAEVLEIPPESLSAETEDRLDSDDLLRLCAYLHVRPESIPLRY